MDKGEFETIIDGRRKGRLPLTGRTDRKIVQRSERRLRTAVPLPQRLSVLNNTPLRFLYFVVYIFSVAPNLELLFNKN